MILFIAKLLFILIAVLTLKIFVRNLLWTEKDEFNRFEKMKKTGFVVSTQKTGIALILFFLIMVFVSYYFNFSILWFFFLIVLICLLGILLFATNTENFRKIDRKLSSQAEPMDVAKRVKQKRKLSPFIAIILLAWLYSGYKHII